MIMKNPQQTLSLLGELAVLLYAAGCAQMPSDASPRSSAQAPMEHQVVASKSGSFYAWPANHGVWTWSGGREILVGFSSGPFVQQSGHNIDGDTELGIQSFLSRSTDGGRTWTIEKPANYIGKDVRLSESPGGINYQHPNLAMRVIGNGYHGVGHHRGGFFLSLDRGRSWRGPFEFGALMDDPNLKEMDCTSRTGYLVTGKDSCLFFMSARARQNGGGRDKSFVAETTDGGKTFHFVSWIVPLSDPHRAVMPAPVPLADGSMVVALRRRIPSSETEACWVDCYGSKDNGRTWKFLSQVGATGVENGNPPALAVLQDGRLACAYGDRTWGKLLARLSRDGGQTWGEEIILRNDFQSDKFGDKDFGYPRLVQNNRGELVAMYYWATQDLPQQHIAATIWKPANQK